MHQSSTRIKKLRLSGHSLTHDFSPLSLTPLKATLEKLDLSHNKITGEKSLQLESLTSLLHLNLSHNQITNISSLGLPSTLQTLNLSGNPNINVIGGDSDSCLSALAPQAPSLLHLIILGTGACLPADHARVLASLPSLQTIDGRTREEVLREYDDFMQEIGGENENESAASDYDQVRASMNSVLTSIDFGSSVGFFPHSDDESSASDDGSVLDASAVAVASLSRMSQMQSLVSEEEDLWVKSPSKDTERMPLAKALASPEAAAFYLDSTPNNDNVNVNVNVNVVGSYVSPGSPLASQGGTPHSHFDDAEGDESASSSVNIRGALLLHSVDETESVDVDNEQEADDLVGEMVERVIRQAVEEVIKEEEEEATTPSPPPPQPPPPPPSPLCPFWPALDGTAALVSRMISSIIEYLGVSGVK